MHGIRRSPLPHPSSSLATRAKKTREAEKLRAYAALEESIFSARRRWRRSGDEVAGAGAGESAGEEDEEMEMLKRTGELLGVNPEVYTVWSFRREIMQRMIGRAKAVKGEGEGEEKEEEERDFFESLKHGYAEEAEERQRQQEQQQEQQQREEHRGVGAPAQASASSRASRSHSHSPHLDHRQQHHQHHQHQQRARDACARQLIGADVELTQHALKAHPKVYWIWNHRAWCLENLPLDEDEVEEGRVDRQRERLQSPRKWKRELKLVDGMLQMDGRNFHGWNYRRQILSKLAILPPPARSSFPDSLHTLSHLPPAYAALHLDLAAQELAYTLRHVEKDFSNFSAWHHRGVILCGYWKAKGWDEDRIRSARDEEFELIKQAMYTDPSDESIWNYHSWLIDQVLQLT
ncbi:Protein geranylgeranyltransferase type II, alpha subunit [Ceraceosorus bombacis]|uniref:Geranylgeranyl transferase type-2 subunit alpha n=1 Tax=Ceraceosorus bombacis TaxID=401625 RepID=A0A0P1BAL5_9BASI|nr:Protein geranylgeranyltransferase type II, alpha subunit [Ceraceosorus bombacis]